LGELTGKPNNSEKNDKGAQQGPEVETKIDVIIGDDAVPRSARIHQIINILTHIKHNCDEYEGTNHKEEGP
jgi:hypothetical protein